MKKLIREFFFLRKGERRALYMVLLLLFLSALVRVAVSRLPVPVFEPDEVFIQHMEEIQKHVEASREKKITARETDPGNRVGADSKKGNPGNFETRDVPLAPVIFDPNTITLDSLLAMNLSTYVSNNIINYREAGGSFRDPGDLAKIYGLEKVDFEALLPYIQIRRRADPGKREPSQTDSEWQDSYLEEGQAWKRDTLYPLELNRADSADLMALPGIGPWFAGRIIRYRELLGGFVTPAQLMEVYGMDSARLNGLLSLVTVDTMLLSRIDLNNSSFREVISHPYINREETYAIFRYREFVDSIRQPENILRDQIIEHDRFMRMAPYLTVKRNEE